MYLKLKDNVYSVGVQNPDLRIFDIIMYTKYGTTYNSYLVIGSEKVALIENVKDKFFEKFLSNIKEIIDPAQIDYLIINHTEPDHSGSIGKLLEVNPKIKIFGSNSAIRFLKKISNKEFDYQVVNDGDQISLGNKTLRFISAPFLHWPDSIYTYLVEDSILFTCDSFGCHYSTENLDINWVMDNDKEGFMDAYKYYYDVIMSPFKNYVLQAIEKIKDLKIDIIATGHGPILTNYKDELIGLYKSWSEDLLKKPEKPYVVIVYVSAYGYTKMLAQKIFEAIEKSGINVMLYNAIEHKIEDILEKIYRAKGVLFGSPTINSDALLPIYEILIRLNPIVHGGKIAAAFGSYGWSGEAVPNIETRLKQLRFKVVEPGLKVNFKPNEEELKKAYEFGILFAEKIKE
ncbi:FprA family A-type flavoprotein [Caldicellulosiruptor naganoensis]|uniref:FprA family A-type flavoprotein n=1 Tax=Caldicellulosiruptor naganoensis TaxID=29324 RepID=A0ABY7BEL4_9FIRM|nr:FprA family A-type flavoprotein [Caldicellulosiruptor naganoensis]WAM30536.1 FprA family A-type flavoprotein [Caldicellulosiruptor naganoensis]